MPGGYSFDHVETLKTIDRYYNSKFKTSQYDVLGQRKFFFNIVKPACDIATKFIDLDTKDIILSPEGSDDEIPTWLMQKKLKRWLKDSYFAELLNEIGATYPKGHVVLKKGKNDFSKVSIQNIRTDTTSKWLKLSPFVYEVDSKTRSEIDSMKWKTDELYARGDDQKFVIYDCYEMSGSKWKHKVYGDLFSTKMEKGGINRAVETEINDRGDFYGALELHSDEVDKLPYYELKWEDVPGRWLGYGFIEYLEENQIAINEAENLERAGLKFSSLQLFQTRDEDAGGSNILTATQNGDILKVNSEITKIQTEERNLAAFNSTRSNWSANTERKTFTSDITTGASLPSRTPLGVANLQAAGASSYFELKRENFGLFVKCLLEDQIIFDFRKETRKEHTLMFAGSDQDIDKLDQLISNMMVENAVIDYANQTGFFPSIEEREALKQRISGDLKKQKNRYLQIPKGFYENVKNYIDINITGENVDNGTKSQVLQLALQIVGTNPAIVQNPVTKNMLFNLLALGGISGVELGLLNESSQPTTPDQTAQMQQMMQPSGSVAKPAAPTPGIGMPSMTQY